VTGGTAPPLAKAARQLRQKQAAGRSRQFSQNQAAGRTRQA